MSMRDAVRVDVSTSPERNIKLVCPHDCGKVEWVNHYEPGNAPVCSCRRPRSRMIRADRKK